MFKRCVEPPEWKPSNCLRLPQGLDIEVDAESRVVTAHNDEVHRLPGVNIDFLMGHVGSKVDKIAWANFGRELKPIAPADLATAFADIDRDFVCPVMMGAGSPIWRQGHGSHPDICTARTRKIKCGSSGPFLKSRRRARPLLRRFANLWHP
jgi:hypothetical protein